MFKKKYRIFTATPFAGSPIFWLHMESWDYWLPLRHWHARVGLKAMSFGGLGSKESKYILRHAKRAPQTRFFLNIKRYHLYWLWASILFSLHAYEVWLLDVLGLAQISVSGRLAWNHCNPPAIRHSYSPIIPWTFSLFPTWTSIASLSDGW